MKLIGELQDLFQGDHARGCQGREYACKCGYDLKVEKTLEAALRKLERMTMALRRITDSNAPASVKEIALLELRDSQHHPVNK